jgi:hypothetical protein
MPVFLPGLGAYVRWAALGVSVQTRAFVSLAGPLAGCVGSAACALLWMKTGDPLWIGLASLSALLNVLNLIPVWVLDGGQAIAALDKTQRIVVSAAAVLFAALFSQPAFLLVAAGAGYRAFDKNLPPEPSHAATLYYVLLLAALGYRVELDVEAPSTLRPFSIPPVNIPLSIADSTRAAPTSSWSTRTVGCPPTPMTSLGGLCLELLSGKGLESAFLEGIGLKPETVFCHHGAVLPKTFMETRTVLWLHRLRLPPRGHRPNRHNGEPSVRSRSRVRCVSFSPRKSGNKSNQPPASTVAGKGFAGHCNPSS